MVSRSTPNPISRFVQKSPQTYLPIRAISLRTRASVEDYLHDVMMRNYRAYMVAGGMPEVVQKYVDSGYSLAEVRSMQALLVKQHAQDIGKYAESRSFEVRAIFDQIPMQLEGETHRFKLSSLRKAARMESFHHDFLWLVNAGVGLQVLQATEARCPLKRTEQVSKFKLYQSDTGMLVSRYPQSAARSIYLDWKDPNFGGVYENVVAQELAALGIPLWYYQANGVGEVDFLMEGKGGKVMPIEVKSGKKVRSHTALDRLLDMRDYKIPEALVLSRSNLSQEGRATYAPLYMTFCLDELVETETETEDFSFAPALP